jgi:type I restriction enzyme M protein
VQEIFANASSFIKKPATLSTLVTEIDKIDWYSVHPAILIMTLIA